jgi:hypothetical protein
LNRQLQLKFDSMPHLGARATAVSADAARGRLHASKSGIKLNRDVDGHWLSQNLFILTTLVCSVTSASTMPTSQDQSGRLEDDGTDLQLSL